MDWGGKTSYPFRKKYRWMRRKCKWITYECRIYSITVSYVISYHPQKSPVPRILAPPHGKLAWWRLAGKIFRELILRNSTTVEEMTREKIRSDFANYIPFYIVFSPQYFSANGKIWCEFFAVSKMMWIRMIWRPWEIVFSAFFLIQDVRILMLLSWHFIASGSCVLSWYFLGEYSHFIHLLLNGRIAIPCSKNSCEMNFKHLT